MGHRQIAPLTATRRERVRRMLALADRISTVLLPLAGITVHPTAPAGVFSRSIFDASSVADSASCDRSLETAQGRAACAAVNNNRQHVCEVPPRRQRTGGERGLPNFATLAAAVRSACNFTLRALGVIGLGLLLGLACATTALAIACLTGCSSSVTGAADSREREQRVAATQSASSSSMRGIDAVAGISLTTDAEGRAVISINTRSANGVTTQSTESQTSDRSKSDSTSHTGPTYEGFWDKVKLGRDSISGEQIKSNFAERWPLALALAGIGGAFAYFPKLRNLKIAAVCWAVALLIVIAPQTVVVISVAIVVLVLGYYLIRKSGAFNDVVKSVQRAKKEIGDKIDTGSLNHILETEQDAATKAQVMSAKAKLKQVGEI